MAAMYSATYSGIVWVDAKTSHFIRIHRFRHPKVDEASGSFDGLWLVWVERHSVYGGGFDVWSWSSSSGSVRRIGGSSAAPTGAGNASDPKALDGFATWMQPSAKAGRNDVRVVDLASGRDRVVFSGRAGPSFLLPKGLVVWSQTPASGDADVLRAASAVTGQSRALPTALRRLRGGSTVSLVTDGRAFAYTGGDTGWTSLWRSPTLTDPAQRLFSVTGEGYFIDNSVAGAGRYLCYCVSGHMYLVDTGYHRYVQLWPGGWALVDKKAIVLLTPATEKASHAISDVIFLPVDSLPAEW